jgi:hypothetical protein
MTFNQKLRSRETVVDTWLPWKKVKISYVKTTITFILKFWCHGLVVEILILIFSIIGLVPLNLSKGPASMVP